MKKAIYLLIIIFFLLFLYARYGEHEKIITNYYELKAPNLPDTFNGFKIVHFSDVLYPNTTSEAKVQSLVKKINNLDADIIVFTGGLFYKKHTPTKSEITFFTKEFKKMNANVYKFAIYEKNDNLNKITFENILSLADFKIIKKEKEFVFYKSSTPLSFTNIMEPKEDSEEVDINEGLSFALLNSPDKVLDISKKYDVYLGSGSMGGYINIPFLGSLISKKDAKMFSSGKYNYKDSLVFISNGIGTDNINLRFLNKPSINVYKIKTTN